MQNHLLNPRACIAYLRSEDAAKNPDEEVQVLLESLRRGGGAGVTSLAGLKGNAGIISSSGGGGGGSSGAVILAAAAAAQALGAAPRESMTLDPSAGTADVTIGSAGRRLAVFHPAAGRTAYPMMQGPSRPQLLTLSAIGETAFPEGVIQIPPIGGDAAAATTIAGHWPQPSFIHSAASGPHPKAVDANHVIQISYGQPLITPHNGPQSQSAPAAPAEGPAGRGGGGDNGGGGATQCQQQQPCQQKPCQQQQQIQQHCHNSLWHLDYDPTTGHLLQVQQQRQQQQPSLASGLCIQHQMPSMASMTQEVGGGTQEQRFPSVIGTPEAAVAAHMVQSRQQQQDQLQLQPPRLIVAMIMGSGSGGIVNTFGSSGLSMMSSGIPAASLQAVGGRSGADALPNCSASRIMMTAATPARLGPPGVATVVAGATARPAVVGLSSSSPIATTTSSAATGALGSSAMNDRHQISHHHLDAVAHAATVHNVAAVPAQGAEGGGKYNGLLTAEVLTRRCRELEEENEVLRAKVQRIYAPAGGTDGLLCVYCCNIRPSYHQRYSRRLHRCA